MSLTPEEQVLMAVHSGLARLESIAGGAKLHKQQAGRLLHALLRSGDVYNDFGWSLTSAGYTRVLAIQEGGVE